MQFTKDQKKVIELHNRNLLVAAAAGAGKTAVLVERMLRMITDEERPVDIDRILVVTFTKAAASEMRERIGAALSQRLLQAPENDHLEKQSALLHNAKITTIDSFCQSVLRNHFESVDLDPAFRVADENEIRLIREDILGELLEERFEEGEAQFLAFADAYQGKGRGARLEDAVADMYEYAVGFPYPQEWLELCTAHYRAGTPEKLEEAPWMKEFLGEVREKLTELAGYIETARSLCHRPEGPKAYENALSQDADALAALLRESRYDGIHRAICSHKKAKLAPVRAGSCDEELKQRVTEIRKKVYAELEKLAKQDMALSAQKLCELLCACRPAVETLVGLVREFAVRFREKKRELNIVDFSDLEHLALDVLVERREDGTLLPTPAALAYREEFEEIFIDEYQDSNSVQELLLKSVSGEDEGRPNRFMVGDVKQSIYRFRLARPEIFLEKYERYSVEESDYQRIDLHQNFRSRREVIDCVNEICGRLMRSEIGHVVYDEAAALYAGAQFPEPDDKITDDTEYRTELLLLDGMQGLSREERIGQEAMLTVQRIRELVGTALVTDRWEDGKGGEEAFLRPASYRDIVVLLRTSGDWFDGYRRVFEQEGIPAYVATRTGYFAASEIRTVFHYLRILDNPRQDIPMYGVLVSFFGGFDEEEIAALRTDGEYLYESLTRIAAEGGEAEGGGAEGGEAESDGDEGREAEGGEAEGDGDEGREAEGGEAEGDGDEGREAEGGGDKSGEAGETVLSRKAAAFLAQYRRLRDRMLYTPIHELLRMLIRDTGYDLFVQAMPGGAKRGANLDALIEKAVAYERTSFHGLFHFMRYMENLQKYEVDYGEADIADERADLVRIMTIHASKGLEFPICFVGGLGKQFNAQDEKKGIVHDAELGIGIDYVNPIARTRTRSLLKSVMNRKERKERLGEELRVLYVALTRAKEKLILTGAVKNYEDCEAALRERLSLYGLGREDALNAGKEAAAPLPCSVIRDASCMLDWVLAAVYAGGLDGRTVTLSVWDKGVLTQRQLAADTADELRKKLLHSKDDGAETEWERRCRERFSFVYPQEALRGLYTKTTVSELKIAALEAAGEERESADTIFPETHAKTYVPRFEKETHTGGTDRGTAYHRALELMDLAAEDSLSALSENLLARAKDGALPAGYYELLNLPKLLRFKQSRLAKRMLAAERNGKLYREQPFVLGIGADRLNPAFPETETVLIQGIIDVFFEEEGGLVVVDYKTDRVSDAEELKRRYQVQLDYYGEALERLTHKKVRQKLLYSFALEEEIVLA